jgi:hypothetical protein
MTRSDDILWFLLQFDPKKWTIQEFLRRVPDKQPDNDFRPNREMINERHISFEKRGQNKWVSEIIKFYFLFMITISFITSINKKS